MRYVAVAGTEGFCAERCEAEWWHPRSAWSQYVMPYGLTPVSESRPFVWTTDLGGAQFWRRWLPGLSRAARTRDHRDWVAGGANLYAYFDPPGRPGGCRVPFEDRNVVAHSHGLATVLYACAGGLVLRSLVSVGSPVRADMQPTAEAARRRIGRWLHLSFPRTDRWQWLGEIGDGALGIVRRHPLADRNDEVPGLGHADVLLDPSVFLMWQERGWLDFVLAAPERPR